MKLTTAEVIERTRFLAELDGDGLEIRVRGIGGDTATARLYKLMDRRGYTAEMLLAALSGPACEYESVARRRAVAVVKRAYVSAHKYGY